MLFSTFPLKISSIFIHYHSLCFRFGLFCHHVPLRSLGNISWTPREVGKGLSSCILLKGKTKEEIFNATKH